MMKDGDMNHQQLLRRVFQMCDVQRRGYISIDDLLELGQSYLGQDTKVILIFQTIHSTYVAQNSARRKLLFPYYYFIFTLS